jgi:hypothetical protein
MKAVVVHGSAAAVEVDWSNQFAGLDADVKNQFSALDWSIRVPQVFTISGFAWSDVVTAVSQAAQAAGAGGVVIVASGHGGAILQGDPNGDGGVINWDPTDHDVDRDWTPEKIRRGLFWDDPVAEYLDPIPFGNPPNQKGIDEQNINNKVKNFQIIQKRHDAFDALLQIGQALKANGVARLTFTVCTAGRATAFMNRIAKLCGVQVACFKEPTRVFDDGTLGLKPGKARLILDKDKANIVVGRGNTNILSARVFSPNLDDGSIAFVGKP